MSMDYMDLDTDNKKEDDVEVIVAYNNLNLKEVVLMVQQMNWTEDLYADYHYWQVSTVSEID